jgi:ectoine hydroxylase-related dioxygenase (phytanoyl-CoA dioxygenase family)
MVEASGSERIDGAVPIVCDPGDVVMCNRQLVHGSFANSGFEPRLTINFGFHKRSSVLNVKGAGIHSAAITYTDEVISERAKAIGFGISARQKQYPHELPYIYEPIASTGVELIWDETTKAKLKDYNALDLSI